MLEELIFFVSLLGYFLIERVYPGAGVIVSAFSTILAITLTSSTFIFKSFIIFCFAIHVGSRLKDSELVANFTFLILAILYPIFCTKKITFTSRGTTPITVGPHSQSTPASDALMSSFTKDNVRISKLTGIPIESNDVVQRARVNARSREIERRKSAAFNARHSPIKISEST